MSSLTSIEGESKYFPRLIVHFIRHAESLHKSPLCENPGSLIDPGLSDKGISDCERFSNDFKDAERITHILCSPMLRSRQTVALALQKIDPAVVGNVIALPHLQTVGAGPNNTGSSVKDMEDYEKLRLKNAKNSVPMDVVTFCDQKWTEKDSGRWSSEKIPWRADFMRGLLSGIWIGCGMKRAEVLIITHGSFLRSFLEDECFSGLKLTTCVLDELSNPRLIGLSELQGIRAASDKLFLIKELSVGHSKLHKSEPKSDEKTLIKSESTFASMKEPIAVSLESSQVMRFSMAREIVCDRRKIE